MYKNRPPPLRVRRASMPREGRRAKKKKGFEAESLKPPTPTRLIVALIGEGERNEIGKIIKKEQGVGPQPTYPEPFRSLPTICRDHTVRILWNILFILLYCHLLPSPRGRHASCHKMSYIKRETKLKKEKKNNISPLCPLIIYYTKTYIYYNKINLYLFIIIH